MKKLILLLLACVIVSPLFAKSKKVQPLVITNIPALKAIGTTLTAGTGIRVENPLSAEVPIGELTESVKSNAEKLDSLADQVTAVLSLRSIMPEDYLFLQMRLSNIRIVEIDAASPLNPTLTAVGTIRKGDHVNPYIWLSPSAVTRSAEIIGKDLQALFPKYSEQIGINLRELRHSLRDLQNEYEQKFLTLEQFEAATMDNSFDYLLKDVNIFITLSLPGEMEWGDEETTLFSEGLKNRAFATVIHRWVPFGDMATDAEKAGVPFTVLSTGFPGSKHFEKGIVHFLRGNLEALLKGLRTE